MLGKVTLVGAGPGDPGLLTLEGLRVLRQAEVVLYDRLVGEAILELIPPGAERIDVGKESGWHPVPQECINALLCGHAAAGRRVVRLKGGDPYLFGRGGEEAEALLALGADVEVVPGVSSALAAPAAAGIPLTHRDHSAAVHIFTGHRRHGGPELDYGALAGLGGTLVFLMGLGALEEICAGLIAAGMPPGRAAALVQNGTRAGQRKLIGTLDDLPRRARKEGFGPPCVLVVGEVCTLSDRLDRAGGAPLAGLRVLVTRPEGAARELASALRELGCEVSCFACIERRPLPAAPELFAQLPRRYAWLVLTSPYGARLFFERLFAAGLDARRLAGVQVAAVGAGTARVIREFGVAADLVPPEYGAECLAGELAGTVKPGERVLLYRARGGTPYLPRLLEDAGIACDDLPAYETLPVGSMPAALRGRILSGRLDCVSFASASAVRGFARVLPECDFAALPALCIGPTTARAAREYGFETIVAERAEAGAMARALLEHKRRRL